ncbi:MAG: hypothetical protein JW984_02865 [Deltaproteobacteria bacterium]|uniref:Uncharacterized protein n=1 Tax=Candidatus Zymogenus saltonus TaxID=2844893 RepID=A0A9D8PM42_9DELT|nr:hypothetical protein [Candidatus Zymogenus saltonus]
MQIETFTCKNCGANVDIPRKSGTATCAYCGSVHKVSFHDGLVTADLISIVDRLDENISLLKGKLKGRGAAGGLKERLVSINEGKKKWHQYVSLVNAGESKDSPDMESLYKEAQEKLLFGYGAGCGELVNNYYNPKILYDDPETGYSCLFILLGTILFLISFGIIAVVYGEDLKLGITLIAVGSALILGGIPFILISIRTEKQEIARKKEAKAKLLEMENKIRQHLSKSKRR